MEEASSIVATNMPQHVLFTLVSDRSPLAPAQTRESPHQPQSRQRQLTTSARSVSLTCTALLTRATPLFNGSEELQVNIWVEVCTHPHILLETRCRFPFHLASVLCLDPFTVAIL